MVWVCDECGALWTKHLAMTIKRIRVSLRTKTRTCPTCLKWNQSKFEERQGRTVTRGARDSA